MILSCAFQNQVSSTKIYKHSCIGSKCTTNSAIINFQSNTQNHPCCPKRELVKKLIAMVNHVFQAISTAFPLCEISFVRCLDYFHVFMLFWVQNSMFLRCECIAIVQRAKSIFLHFLVMKLDLIINRLRSLCGR